MSRNLTLYYIYFHMWPYLISILTIIKLWDKPYLLHLVLDEIEVAKDLNNTTDRIAKLPFEPRPTQKQNLHAFNCPI